jgi:hypothetical protein
MPGTRRTRSRRSDWAAMVLVLSRMARAAIVIAALTLYLAVASTGQAATVTAIPRADKYGPYTDVSVVAGAGERNHITVEYEQSATRVRDTVPLEAGPGCALQPNGSVLCADIARVLEVQAGDRDDRVEVQNGGAIRRLFGEAGDDTLVSRGDRPAEFTGGDGDDRMVGSSATDTFLEGSSANGSDRMIGGEGDTVSYAKRVNNVHADLAGDADDGEAGSAPSLVAPATTSSRAATRRTCWSGPGAPTCCSAAAETTCSRAGSGAPPRARTTASTAVPARTPSMAAEGTIC